MTCPNPALYGITAGDYTENACADHALIVVDRLAPPGRSVMIYQLQADRPCQFRSHSAEAWGQMTGPPDRG